MGRKKAIDQRWYSRHGLIDGLHSVSHGELIHYLLGHVVIVDLPGLLPFHLGDLHHPAVLILGQVVEQVLKVAAKIKEGRGGFPVSASYRVVFEPEVWRCCEYWRLVPIMVATLSCSSDKPNTLANVLSSSRLVVQLDYLVREKKMKLKNKRPHSSTSKLFR